MVLFDSISLAGDAASTASGLTLNTQVKVLLVDNADGICGGVIGGSGGARFCTLRNCQAKSHLVKVPVKDQCLYIRHSRVNQAKTSPYLKVSLLPRGTTVESIQEEEHPVDIWTTYFWGCQSYAEKADDSTVDTAVTVPSLNDLKTTRGTFRTPSRVLIHSLLADAVPLSPEGEIELHPMRRLLELGENESGATVQIAHMLDEWNFVLQNIEILEERMRSRNEQAAQYRDSLLQHFSKAMNVVDGNTTRILLLSGQIGKLDDINDGGRTLVEVIAEVQEAVNRMEVLNQEMELFETQTKDRLEELAAFETDVKGSFANISESFLDFKKAYNTDRAMALSMNPRDEIKEIKTSLRNLERRNKGKDLTLEPGKSSLTSDFELLKQEFATLENYVRYHSAEDIKRSVIPENTEREDLSSSSHSVGGKDWESVDKRLNEVESRVSSEGFVGGGVSFSSQHDVEAWVEDHGKPSCGFFWDLFSVLCVMEPKYLTSKERSDWKYSAERVKSTLLEVELTASMAHLLPPTLYATKKAELNEKDEGFGACPSHDDWVGGKKRKAFVEKSGLLMDAFLGSVEKSVMHRKNKLDDQGKRLAVSLLDKTRSHWNALTRFIESYHTKLTRVSKFPTEKAWPLIGQCVGAIFEAMWMYRSKVDKMQDSKDPEEIAGVIWTVVQCHRIMEDFIKVEFHGHPAIVKEITHFMITNRIDPEALAAVEDELAEVKSHNKKLREQLKAQDDKLAQMHRKLENMSQSVDALKKKVK